MAQLNQTSSPTSLLLLLLLRFLPLLLLVLLPQHALLRLVQHLGGLDVLGEICIWGQGNPPTPPHL